MTTAIWAVVAAAALVGIDQAFKAWASAGLAGGSIDLIPGVLSLTYHENFGAAFGILQNQRVFLVLMTLVIIAGACYLILSGKLYNRYLVWSVALILAGGVGNLIDRTFNGYVVDYIYFELINFPIFNFADCCVVIGTCLVVVYILFEDKFSKKRHARTVGEED